MKKIAIYGTGNFGKIFYWALGGQIDYFVDDYFSGKAYMGKEVKRYEDIDKSTKLYISPLQNSDKITKRLISKGYKNVFSFGKSIQEIPNLLKEIAKTDYLWMSADSSVMLDEKKLDKVFPLLKDQYSKDLLISMIRLRQTLSPEFYIQPKGIEYFPDDLPFMDGFDDISYIDCGAYTGDTVSALLKQSKSNVRTVVSFEPDHNNFYMLKKTFANLKGNYPETNFVGLPLGVFSKNTMLSFKNNATNPSASTFLEASNRGRNIPVICLDDTIQFMKPTHIKMDVEGTEYAAIRGAEKTIARHRPNLAICLYHNSSDLWELPSLIHEIEPCYDMYIRVHEDLCLSTVLYCIFNPAK